MFVRLPITEVSLHIESVNVLKVLLRMLSWSWSVQSPT